MYTPHLFATLAMVLVGCAGEDARAYLTALADEPAGAQCAAGGVRIDAGPDLDGDGQLGADEIDDTKYVCAGADGAPGSSGGAQVVKVFSAAGVPATTGTPVTLISGQITTDGPGSVVAIGSTDVFCTLAECPAATPAATGHYWLSPVDNLGVPAADFDFFYLTPEVSESITRTVYVPITAAGTHAVHARGQDGVGTLTFYRSALTLVFLPE